MDFVFGTLINDTLKLASHRAERSGVQHRHNIHPLKPSSEDDVVVHLITGSDIHAEHATLYYTTDESIPKGSRGIAQNGTTISFSKVRTEWDTLVWGYLTHWQATIPAQPNHTMVQYTISVWTDDGDEIYADYPKVKEQVEHAAMIHFKNIPEDTEFVPHDPSAAQAFNYHIDDIQAPNWVQDAIIYHIFIDRFYHGDGHQWQEADSRDGFYGGTLWGVRDKLDYLADLGINCIWLSPTWVSPSNHGYDVVDYEQTEPRLGGDEALRAVIEGAHQRNIRVLLDMACNHISNEHPIFLDALNDENSPYRDWFFFDNDLEHGYKGFFNVKTMPEINLSHPDAREWMVNNAVRWIRDFDIDGYRLDYAVGPGPDFWSVFRRACKTVKPDCLLFGEVIDSSDKLRNYIGRLDGCLDFPMNEALRLRFAWQKWDDSQLQAFLSKHSNYFPDNFVMPTFLDNHDMDRFSYIADNETDLLKQAVQIQMSLPNPPIIYYGTEVGVQQKYSTREEGLHVSRVPMLWDKHQDTELLNFYKQQIQKRKHQSKY